MQSLNILIVEDHDVLRESIVKVLKGRGHRAVGLICAEDVDDGAPQSLADLYIIDVNLPGEDGLSLAQRIRHAEPRAGIIVMTGRNHLTDRLDSFTSGADIFLSKPVDPAELAACVEALAKRLAPLETDHALRLDAVRHVLSGPAGDALLTRTEVLLLAAMNRANDRQLERWQAMEYVDPADKGLSRASLEMCISAVRKKLLSVGAESPTILSVRGIGYRLCPKLVMEQGVNVTVNEI